MRQTPFTPRALLHLLCKGSWFSNSINASWKVGGVHVKQWIKSHFLCKTFYHEACHILPFLKFMESRIIVFLFTLWQVPDLKHKAGNSYQRITSIVVSHGSFLVIFMLTSCPKCIAVRECGVCNLCSLKCIDGKGQCPPKWSIYANVSCLHKKYI